MQKSTELKKTRAKQDLICENTEIEACLSEFVHKHDSTLQEQRRFISSKSRSRCFDRRDGLPLPSGDYEDATCVI